LCGESERQMPLQFIDYNSRVLQAPYYPQIRDELGVISMTTCWYQSTDFWLFVVFHNNSHRV